MLGWGIEYKRMEYKRGEKLYSSCMQQILVKHLLYAGSVHRTGIPHAPMVFCGQTWKGKRQVRCCLPGAFTQAQRRAPEGGRTSLRAEGKDKKESICKGHERHA